MRLEVSRAGHWEGLADLARRIDECRDAGRSRAEQVAIGFDGAEARLPEMLRGRGRPVVPRVVRDRDEHLRAVANLLARDLRIDDLVADRRAVFHFAGQRKVVRAELERADGMDELLCEEEHDPPRNVLAERHEPELAA